MNCEDGGDTDLVAVLISSAKEGDMLESKLRVETARLGSEVFETSILLEDEEKE